ncbi:MAG: GlsB/YeaQ/YmgE family stress response membrane protein [Bacteroidota bacterium]
MSVLIMIIVGGIAGSLASWLVRGNTSGLINIILGIAGAVVGGMIFDFLGFSPGGGIVKAISETFGVDLPKKFVGMIVSATIGAILIIYATKLLRGGKG